MHGFLLFLVALLTVTFAQGQNCSEYASNPALQLLQDYIRINTTTYNDLTPAVEFWRNLAASESLPFAVYNFTEGFPVLVITWAGSDSSAPSIMLNSHMDVVPADENDGWTYPPFAATLTNACQLYGRGTQDMKSVAIQYFYALKELTSTGTLLRNIYMTLMPDEEVGAEHGMIPFLASAEYAALNVGLEMDEGSPFPVPQVPLFVQDKVVWQILVTCYGVAAHGSTFSATNDTATGKCRNVMERLFQYRDEQYEVAELATMFNAGAYTSINLNKINAGTANNIVPGTVTLVYDIRLGTNVNEETLDAQLREWIGEAGDNITLSYILKNPQSPATLTTSGNPYMVAIEKAFADSNLTYVPLVAPGSTDARFVRSSGTPAFGLSPMPETPLLLHAVDEYISVKTFLDGISFYKKMIENLANIQAEETSTNGADYLVDTTSS